MRLSADPIARMHALVLAARRIADPGDPLGRAARSELPRATGLSREGVELALTRCLETHPSDREIESLVASAASASRAHVVLSANVFVAAHRAIALAVAAAADVSVRPSRRESTMARLLGEGAPGLFQVVERLDVRSGDQVWAYGSDETIDALRRELPAGATLLAHGHGIGAAFVELREGDREEALAEALAEDVIVFDQRGCLSPRVVFVRGETGAVERFAEGIAAALERAEKRVPLGILTENELGARARYRDTARVVGVAIPAGSGWVGMDPIGNAVTVPPVGRNVHVVNCADPSSVSSALRRIVTTVGVHGSATFTSGIAREFTDARVTKLGSMQTPPFDGPVDRRKR